jgi:hypothetical protein
MKDPYVMPTHAKELHECDAGKKSHGEERKI